MTDKPKAGIVIITTAHEFKTYRPEDVPDEFIQALAANLERLIEAGRTADDDFGEDITDLTPDEIVAKLSGG